MNNNNNTGNSLVSTSQSMSAVPSANELDLIMRQADMLARSTIVPRDYQNKPGNVVAAALMGRSFGWDAMSSMRLITVIQGTATIKPEAMLALIRSRGHSVQVTREADRVIVKGTRCDNGDIDLQSFSLKDAERAGLLRNNTWKQYPIDMCQWRAVSRLARSLFSDVVLGAGYTPEEIVLARSAEGVIEVEDYVDAAVIEAAAQLTPANEAKRLLVEATNGDKAKARELWEWVRGDINDARALSPEELSALLALAASTPTDDAEIVDAEIVEEAK